jgi:hypothetical protein
MMREPCLGCGSRLRVEMQVDVVGDTAIVSVCWACGYAHEVVAVVDEDGNWTATDYADDAMDDATTRVMDLGPRMVWLRRCRDLACLRWSATSNLRWLLLARRLEAARRRHVEPLQLVRDPDRVDLGPAHVELLAITRTEVTARGHGTARHWIVARRGFRVPGGPGVFVESRGAASVDLSDALLEAARMDGVFSTTEAHDQGRKGATEAPQGGGEHGGPAALGNAGEDGAA